MTIAKSTTKGFWELVFDPFFLPLARVLESSRSRIDRENLQVAASIAERLNIHGNLDYCREYRPSSGYIVRFRSNHCTMIYGGLPVLHDKIDRLFEFDEKPNEIDMALCLVNEHRNIKRRI